MTGPTVLLLIALIAALGTFALLLANAELDEILDRWRYDRDVRESIEAERRKAAALRGGWVR